VGGAVITGAGNLNARFVIHAVGPVFGEGEEDRKLELATLNSLKLAEEFELNSIAFPAISTGIFHFPLQRCSEVMLHTTLKFLVASGQFPETAMFCLYGEEAHRTFTETLEGLMRSAGS
jgi:O-acetyl-ADP-ribose deacetylase (regulator of RNase III)